MADGDSYDEIRRRVEQRYKKRQELYIHIASFVVANVFFWIMFHDSWVWWITVGWGIGIVSHVIDYYSKYGGGAERKEAAIQREIEREMALRNGYEKPKNDERDVPMRLTDDGELEEVPDYDDSVSGHSKRG
jgi:hypothetical protein